MINDISSNYEALCKLFDFTKKSRASGVKKTRIIVKQKLSYEDCKKEVISLGIEGEKQYRKKRNELKKHNWPALPYVFYKEWIDWYEFCGTRKIEILNWNDFLSSFREECRNNKINSRNYSEFRKENWPKAPSSYYREWAGWDYLCGGVVVEPYRCKDISFKDLKEEVKNCNVTSFPEYRKCYKNHNWPASPRSMYENEWVSFNHFFGKEKKFLSYEDLVVEVRKAEISSMTQYHEYRIKNNKKSWNSTPHKFAEWTNNFDFFGKDKDHWAKKGISSYKDAKTLEQLVKEIRDNGVKTRKEYRKNCKKLGWPANPDDAYKDCWKGWDFLFSREEKVELSWNEFVAQVRDAKIKGFWDYRNRYKNYKGWVSHPMKKYAEDWTTWTDLLGKHFSKKNSENQYKNKISWEELKMQVRAAGIETQPEYRMKCKEYGWASNPEKSYPDNWNSWDDFIGKRQITFSQLKEEVKLNNIKGQVEYRKRHKEFDGWPSAPERVFENEWKDWFDFLSKPRDKYHQEAQR
jgi:hypothetical protein